MRLRATITLWLLSLLVILTGCFSPSDKRFVDVPRHESRPKVTSITADGDSLRITIVQDVNFLGVYSIEALVINGDVYLRPICISGTLSNTEFKLDLSAKRFPPDWKNRLYWIEEDMISSPFNPAIHHYREIRRSKIVLDRL